MTRSAPRYSLPADRARRVARDPFMVRLVVLLAAGVIVAPIAALIARSNGGEVVQGGNLPGAAVAVEPAGETTTSVAVPPPQLAAGTVPATVPPAATLPATIAPPTTVPQPEPTDAPAQAAATAAPAPKTTAAPAAVAPKPPPTTSAPPPPPQPRNWGESEVVAIIRAVFPDDIEEHALEIAHRESRFDPNAQNFCCTGLFQIYGDVHVKLINSLGFGLDQLTDPFVNSVVAYALYQRSGWAPWGG